MPVTRIKLEAFMVKVARTRDAEAGCDDCAKHSARLVDALLSGNVEDAELLDILHHVLMCMPCSEEFHILEDCARMDAEDSWPTFDELWASLYKDR
jgi:hypothetical protein